MTPDAAPVLLRPDEVCRRLSVKPSTLRTHAREGRIAAVKTPGGHWRYPVEAVRGLYRAMYREEPAW